jgi:MoxR-like ATPase
MPNKKFFTSPDEVKKRLDRQAYLGSDEIATTVFLAGKLGKPVLVEGPAGTGKTELAKVVASALRATLIRLQCYEGLDEAKALYEWDYQAQLLRIQANNLEKKEEGVWARVKGEIFSEEFLLARPLLQALMAEKQVVLLIDEIDKTDEEFEAFLLEVLSDFQVSVPELGTIKASRRPIVFLTSNAQRDLSDALKRRCLHLYIDYPTPERELAIVLRKVEGISAKLAKQLVNFVQRVRNLDWLKKKPSISETLDWARALMALGADQLNPELVKSTLNVILKHQKDVEGVSRETSNLLSGRPVVKVEEKEEEPDDDPCDGCVCQGSGAKYCSDCQNGNNRTSDPDACQNCTDESCSRAGGSKDDSDDESDDSKEQASEEEPAEEPDLLAEFR